MKTRAATAATMMTTTMATKYLISFVIVTLIALVINGTNAKNYTNHAVFEVSANLLNDSLPYGQLLWHKTSESENVALVSVPPHQVHRLKRDTRYRFVAPNLQEWIDNAMVDSNVRRYQAIDVHSSLSVKNFRLDKYHTWEEVEHFLGEVARLDNVRLFDIGVTHEGRKIKAIEIRNNPTKQEYMWLDATTHAREWITVSTILYIIDKLISDKAPVNAIIVPVINPDGYVYTWTVDRLWRKNRRPPPFRSQLNQDECFGIDLNRNWDINFGGEGSSKNPCSHLYQGTQAFSEPESAAAARTLYGLRNQVKLFVSLHSFNELWACPFAFTTADSPHRQEHLNVLRDVQIAVYNTHGKQYQIGPLSVSLYVGSGFSMDWAYSKLGIIHSYLVELRDNGQYGFLLPADQIIPTAEETWNGLQAAMSHTLRVR